VRPDPHGAFVDSKINGFGCFSPSDKASDWIADRLAEGHTGIGAWDVDFPFRVVTALALCNHHLTLLYVDVSMRSHRVK
jgi:hypothetical protein